MDNAGYRPKPCTPMSTVIVSYQTAEGFVLASDGRKSSAKKHEVLSDDAQKIFKVEQSSGQLAYGLAGTIQVGDANDTVLFDFADGAAQAVERLTQNRYRDWFRYISALAADLNNSLNQVRHASGATLPVAIESTWIFIGGVFGKHLKAAHIVFQHGMTETKVEPHTHTPNFNGPFGSGKIFELIDKEDPRLVQYSRPRRDSIVTLSDAIERARNDIRAHCDPVAIQIDEDHCWATGGRIQIATVTCRDGFQWVPGFESSIVDTSGTQI